MSSYAFNENDFISNWETIVQQYEQPHAAQSMIDTEVDQGSFLLNDELNWASCGGYSGRMEDQGALHPNAIGNNGLPAIPTNAHMQPQFQHHSPGGSSNQAHALNATDNVAHDSSSNGSPVTPQLASAPADGNSAPFNNLPSSSSSSEAEHASTTNPATNTKASSNLVPNLLNLMKAADIHDRAKTTFPSIESANIYLHANADLPEDPTVPYTQPQKRVIIEEMCKAIRSTEHAMDSEGMKRPFAELRYSDERIESCCWHVLETVIMRQTKGPLLGSYMSQKLNNEHGTFVQRMTKVIECFYKHKTICKHVLDPIYLYNLVDDPIAAEKRVISNRTLNHRKGLILTAGKIALQGQNGDQPPRRRGKPASKKPRQTKRATSTKEKVTEPTTSIESVKGSDSTNTGMDTPSNTPEHACIVIGATSSKATATPTDSAAMIPSTNATAAQANTATGPLSSSPVTDDKAIPFHPQHMLSGHSSYGVASNLAYPAPGQLYHHHPALVYGNVMMPPMQNRLMGAPASHLGQTVDYMGNPLAPFYSPNIQGSMPFIPGAVAENAVRHSPMMTDLPTREQHSMHAPVAPVPGFKRSNSAIGGVKRFSSPNKKHH